MRKLSQFLMAIVLSLLIPTVSRAAAPPASAEKQEISNRPKIAIADFRGADVETSRFLAETIISNLAASRTLKPLDRPTVRRALAAELTEADAEPTQEEIVSTGKRLRSAYFVTGSYLIQEDKILLLAHIHTIKDEDAPSIQLRCTGDRTAIMDVAKQLSDQIESQLAPREEVHVVRDEAPAPREEPRLVERPVEHPVVPAAPALPDPFVALRASGLCPTGVTSGANLSEGDLARLLGRLADTAAVHASFTLPHNNTPAPRMLALTGLVKLMLTPEEIADYRQNPPANLPADFAHVPLWGQPFLAAAVDHGWWDSAKAFRPGINTNWAFIAIVAGKMGMIEPPHEVMKVEPTRDLKPIRPIEDDEIYTGLIVDGRDFKVERSQAPSILDEDGNFVYPYEKHAPSPDYVGENGMVDYNVDAADQTRAGKHPLVVQAIKLAGPFHDDLVLSNEDAERVRRAQKRSQFLWKWKVVFLIPNN
jgi:TolB-like protein